MLPTLALLLALRQQTPPQGPPPAPTPAHVDDHGTVVIPAPIPPAYEPPRNGLDVPNSTSSVTNVRVPPTETGEPAGNPDQEVRVRILDLVEIDGVRSNQLTGFGLVTGLSGTGDKGFIARQALSNFVRRNNLNVNIPDIDVGNIALVTVTCTLRPWAKEGMPTDVEVQSVNGASSLFGGFLLQTPLKGADGEVYVVAQGPVVVGGFSAGGKGASVTQNHLTSGTLSQGGIVEREVPMHVVANDGVMHLHLRSPNYTTALRVAREIQKIAPATLAQDGATVRVELPASRLADPIAFLSEIGEHLIVPDDEAVVVVNERTGTVVIGAHVRISTALITHGNLTISVAESDQVSQPSPFSEGETTTVPRTDLNAQVENRGLQVVSGGTTVSQLASSLNRLGVAPRDLVAIFQSLQQAGYLHARLEIR
jgi:flagellar P-ring protein precursor FlgI